MNSLRNGGIGEIMTRGQAWDRGEPSLEELLSDPIFECLMRRDGLTREDVLRAVEAGRRGLYRERSSAAA